MASSAPRRSRRIPDATVARLPLYHRILVELAGQHEETVSSERLAELAGVNAAKVRKDLSYLGSYGTRGVGYEVEYLLFKIAQELGLTHRWPVVIAGAGNLGRALANYAGFGDRGFPIVAIVDTDPEVLGTEICGVEVTHIDDLPTQADETEPTIGIVATPAKVAQSVVDRLVDAGVSAILNFAPALVTVPDHVPLRKVDLALELQILSFYQARRVGSLGSESGPPAP